MRRTGWIVFTTIAAFGCGGHNVYEVQLEPRPEGLQRTLTAWREDTQHEAQPAGVAPQPNKPLPDAELQRLAALYPERLSQANDIRQRFRGTFVGKLPADVGGHGTYKVDRTPLGAGYVYLERFRGNIDVDAELYDRRAAVDRGCDLLVGFFDLHLKDAPERGQVRKFLHQDFRQDARNLAVLIWRAAEDGPLTESRESGVWEVSMSAARIFQYLEERQYCTLEELRAGGGDPVQNFARVRRVLTRKCGFEHDAGEKLFAFLCDSAELQTSWNEYLRQTPEYEQLRKQARAAGPAGQPPADPDPAKVVETVLSPVLKDLVDGLLPAGRDELRLSLSPQQRPFETNGQWFAQENCVRWDHRMRTAGGAPTVCYAAWSIADDAFQHAHFGRTAVRDKQLAEFAALYGSLTAAQREEFDKHLAALEPGDAIKGRVQDFQFVGPADDDARATARRMVEILAGCL